MFRLDCVTGIALLAAAATSSAALPRLHAQSLPARDAAQQPGAGQSSGSDKGAPRADRLQPRSRLEIIRFVSGEFARAVNPLPGGKKGFRFMADETLDQKALRQAVANYGAAASPGDTVQVTKVEFRAKEIVIDINGGGKGRTRFRDRIQVSVGGIPRVTTTTNEPGFQRLGSTLILDFGRPVPDLTPDQLKSRLRPLLDFSKQRSAAKAWVETLAPEFQQAIKEKKAIVGMDREMVIAALGRPERKVRARDPDGWETEDWIYGHPPSKTIFVTFAGEKVTSVKQFP